MGGPGGWGLYQNYSDLMLTHGDHVSNEEKEGWDTGRRG